MSFEAELIAKLVTDGVLPALTKSVKEWKKKQVPVKALSRTGQIKKIANEYKSNRLVLVLGAGLSMGHGLPSWEALLQKLLFTTIQSTKNLPGDKSMVVAKLFTDVFSSSPLIAARYLREHFSHKKSNTDARVAFEKAVKKAIYEEIEMNEELAIFKEIRQLCAAPGKSPNLDSIITYNYDDILETYLRAVEIKIPFKEIYSLGMRPTHGELPIYHVHGYLPKAKAPTTKNKITLSEDIYHQQYSDIYSWNNIVQLNKFTEKTCLLIGLSFTDPNLRRLMEIAYKQKGDSKEYHYLLKRRYQTEDIKNSLINVLQSKKELYDEKVQAMLRLDETARYLIDLMTGFEEKDALSFGVQIIWTDSYDDYPEILKEIRSHEE